MEIEVIEFGAEIKRNNTSMPVARKFPHIIVSNLSSFMSLEKFGFEGMILNAQKQGTSLLPGSKL